jgi:hypothetical protein
VTPGRRCEYPGCRAWAVRGEGLCRAHLGRGRRSAITGKPDDERLSPRVRAVLEQRIDEVVSRFVSDASLERESLTEEIGALRVVLARLLVEEDDPTRLALSIPRVVDAVVRAIRAQRSISGEMADSLTAAVTQVLIELGLDDSR